MSTPAWLLDILGAAMLLVAEVSAGQLVAARALAHGGGPGAATAVPGVLTGIALASVLVPGLSVLPHAAWAAAFAVMTGWLAWRLWRARQWRGAAALAGGRTAPLLVLLVHSTAMLYLFAALPGPSGAGSGPSVSVTGGMPRMPGMASVSSGGMPALTAPTLALAFALLLIACAVQDLDRLAGPGTSGQAAHPGAERLLLSPAVARACRVAAGVTMAFILIIMS